LPYFQEEMMIQEDPIALEEKEELRKEANSGKHAAVNMAVDRA